MEDKEIKLRELEVKLDELAKLHEEFHQHEKEQLNENDVYALIDQYLTEKGYISESELHSQLSRNKVSTMKWVVATGLSIATITISIIHIFL
ncbi:hypothetical protein ACFSCX_20845 [Bacillus salitolerans]|uniref:Uncharacterized protein n=1 Tax=Bacillus salitolerans TaxID=1437434 RepID=A0ABW4LUW5_9BACI